MTSTAANRGPAVEDQSSSTPGGTLSGPALRAGARGRTPPAAPSPSLAPPSGVSTINLRAAEFVNAPAGSGRKASADRRCRTGRPTPPTDRRRSAAAARPGCTRRTGPARRRRSRHCSRRSIRPSSTSAAAPTCKPEYGAVGSWLRRRLRAESQRWSHQSIRPPVAMAGRSGTGSSAAALAVDEPIGLGHSQVLRRQRHDQQGDGVRRCLDQLLGQFVGGGEPPEAAAPQ